MPKLSDARIVALTKTPEFFESFQFLYGSYAQAGKKLRIDPKTLSALANAGRDYSISDARLKQVKKAIGKMAPSDYKIASYFPDASKTMTPGQIEYARRYSRKGIKGRQYFKKAVKEYHDEKTRRVLMPGIRKTKEGEFIIPVYPKTIKLQRKKAVRIVHSRKRAARRIRVRRK
jgi:hypothetical protein